MESIFWYLFRKFRVVSVCFALFRNSLFQYQKSDFRCFNWTKTNRRPAEAVWQRAYFGIFQKISGCFGLFRNSSVCSSCFDIGSKHRKNPVLVLYVHPLLEEAAKGMADLLLGQRLTSCQLLQLHLGEYCLYTRPLVITQVAYAGRSRSVLLYTHAVSLVIIKWQKLYDFIVTGLGICFVHIQRM